MFICIVLPEPFVLFVVDARFLPRISVEMPDAPCIAHRVSRSCRLGVELRRDRDQSVVRGLEDLAVGKARAEALRGIEPVEIYLRLRVVMRRLR